MDLSIAGTEQSVGDAPTALACAQLVQQSRPTANGATYQQGGTACYAEFGMTNNVNVASTTWQTCMLPTDQVSFVFKMMNSESKMMNSGSIIE